MGNVQVIRQWINPKHLSSEAIQLVEKQFYANQVPSIQLADFFIQDKAEEVYRLLEKIKYNHDYIPHLHSYATVKIESVQVLKPFFSFLDSSGFKALIGTMLKHEIKTIEPQILMLQHKDYTLAQDSRILKDTLLFCFDFTQNWPADSGGKTGVLPGKSEQVFFNRMFNSLCIIKLKPDSHYFLKYINANAGRNKVFLVISQMPLEIPSSS